MRGDKLFFSWIPLAEYLKVYASPDSPGSPGLDFLSRYLHGGGRPSAQRGKQTAWAAVRTALKSAPIELMSGLIVAVIALITHGILYMVDVDDMVTVRVPTVRLSEMQGGGVNRTLREVHVGVLPLMASGSFSATVAEDIAMLVGGVVLLAAHVYLRTAASRWAKAPPRPSR